MLILLETCRKKGVLDKTKLEIEYSQSKERSASETLELLEKFKNEACELEEMFKNGNSKVREYLLKSALWNLKVKEKKMASVQYKLPYAYLEKAAKNPTIENLLAGLDSNIIEKTFLSLA